MYSALKDPRSDVCARGFDRTSPPIEFVGKSFAITRLQFSMHIILFFVVLGEAIRSLHSLT